MEVNILDWDKSVSYKRGDLVKFHDKVYICNEDNVGIIPIPVVKNDLFGELSNVESVEIIASRYFEDTEGHLNSNRVWLTVK